MNFATSAIVGWVFINSLSVQVMSGCLRIGASLGASLSSFSRKIFQSAVTVLFALHCSMACSGVSTATLQKLQSLIARSTAG